MVRAQGVGLDDFILRWGNRLIGRRKRSPTWPDGPPLLVAAEGGAVTTVPVPSAELTVGRQGHYAGAVSRLAAFAADVGASWGLYALGGGADQRRRQARDRAPYTLTNHQVLALISWCRLGVPLLRLPVGGQRQDAGHGRLRPAGGDRSRAGPSARARRSSAPSRSGPACSPWASASWASSSSASAGPSTTSGRHGGGLRLGRPGRPAALDGPQGGAAAPRARAHDAGAVGDHGALAPRRIYDAAPCPSPKSPDRTPRSPSSP